MQLIDSFTQMLAVFAPVFTAPTFDTFVQVVTGWLLSSRHRYVTEVIFASGNVGKGHWSKFHRFFSHAAWNLDVLSMHLAWFTVKVLTLGGTLLWAVDDTLCRKRGLTLYGAGMHHDPLISSRAKPLVNWGHDWVVLCLVLVHPFWAPTKVFALPVAFRLYRNRQGRTKGKKATGRPRQPDPSHRTRPELAIELIRLVSQWFPQAEIVVTGDSAYGGQSVLSHLPNNVHLISRVHPKGALYEPAPPRSQGTKGPARKRGKRLSAMEAWAKDGTPWQELVFDQFGLHATLQVKVRERTLYYKAGKDRPLTIVLVRDVLGQRPDQMFYCTKLDWDARQILSTYANRWAIECTFENAKQLLGLEDPANRLPKAVERTAPLALVCYTLAILWFHGGGHRHVRFPTRPWYSRKAEPSFADILTTLRRLSLEVHTAPLLPKRSRLKAILSQITELACRAG